MSGPILGKMDVTLIDKSKFFIGKPAKDGHTPKYLDFVLIPKKEGQDKYDDFMIVQSVSKEERARGIQGKILGNARFMGRDKKPEQVTPPTPQNDGSDFSEPENVPF